MIAINSVTLHNRSISDSCNKAEHFTTTTCSCQCHVMPPIISQSNDPLYDRLLGDSGLCGHASKDAYQDRCGYGARLPLLMISPYAKVKFVDHTVIDQSSILRFIEDNWVLGRIGDQSFDEKAGSLLNMFNFTTTANY